MNEQFYRALVNSQSNPSSDALMWGTLGMAIVGPLLVPEFNTLRKEVAAAIRKEKGWGDAIISFSIAASIILIGVMSYQAIVRGRVLPSSQQQPPGVTQGTPVQPSAFWSPEV